MNDDAELIRRDGERIEIIPTPDAAIGDAALSLDASNRALPVWQRRIRVQIGVFIFVLIFSILAGWFFVSAFLPPDAEMSARFFNATPLPIAIDASTPTP